MNEHKSVQIRLPRPAHTAYPCIAPYFFFPNAFLAKRYNFNAKSRLSACYENCYLQC